MSDLALFGSVYWEPAYRIINSAFPPIFLFEDIADPADWEHLASAEAKTDPSIWSCIGNLALVPVEQRVSGPGASYVMAPFVHARPGRFTDGSYGIYSAGNAEEVAVREVAHHYGKFMAASNEAADVNPLFLLLLNRLDVHLFDLRSFDDCHRPENYSIPQATAAWLRRAGANGILYRSVRHPGGECVAVFRPDIIPIPQPAGRFAFSWDGQRVDYARNLDTGVTFPL